jgi:hypothetical protein
MYEVEIAYGGEVTILQSRISNLEVLVCELLAKNERLRTAVRSESGLGSETFGLIGRNSSDGVTVQALAQVIR